MRSGLVWLSVVCAAGTGCQQILGIDSPHEPIDSGVDGLGSSTSVTLTLPGYLDLSSSGTWRADLVGPAGVTASYAWSTSPPAAVTMMPSTGSATLDLDGHLQLTGTVVAGASAASVTAEFGLTGATEGTGSGAITVASFQTYGNRAQFANTTDVPLVANRLFATPVSVPQGARIIAFGLRDGSIASDVKLGLYATSGTEPGGLLLESPTFHAVPGESLTYLSTPQTLTAPAAYLAVIAATNVSIPINGASGQEVPQFTRDTAFAQPLPSSFGQTASFMGGASNVFVVAVP